MFSHFLWESGSDPREKWSGPCYWHTNSRTAALGEIEKAANIIGNNLSSKFNCDEVNELAKKTRMVFRKKENQPFIISDCP